MSEQQTSQSSFGIYSLYALGAIACFVFFQFFYPYHLFYQEQNQLFLASWDYLTTYLETGMAGLSGRRFPDPVLLFPLCRSYHPYPLYSYYGT